jgi:hypothetical protein
VTDDPESLFSEIRTGVARLEGLEPTTSAFAGLRSNPTELQARVVPKERFELSRPCEHYALNVARLPFRHFGIVTAAISLARLLAFVY